MTDSPGDSPSRPGDSTSPTSDSTLDDAIAGLAGWRRDGDQLVRQVPVAAADQDNLERAVMKVADELDHHPVIDRDAKGMTFRLWTHTVGRITARDVELAARIDQTLSGTVQD